MRSCQLIRGQVGQVFHQLHRAELLVRHSPVLTVGSRRPLKRGLDLDDARLGIVCRERSHIHINVNLVLAGLHVGRHLPQVPAGEMSAILDLAAVNDFSGLIANLERRRGRVLPADPQTAALLARLADQGQR